MNLYLRILGTIELALLLYLIFFKTEKLWLKKSYFQWVKNLLKFTIFIVFISFLVFNIFSKFNIIKFVLIISFPMVWLAMGYLVQKFFYTLFNAKMILKNYSKKDVYLLFIFQRIVMRSSNPQKQELINIGIFFSALFILLIFVILYLLTL